MGVIAGAGVVSHAPVVMFPEAQRRALNGGADSTLATGLTRLRSEVFDRVPHDLVVVLDSHWATTTEYVITAHRRRAGRYTSDEMPAVFRGVPHDLPGDPEFARAVADLAAERSAWVHAEDDPDLPVHYATLNPWSYLGLPGVPWVSMSVCQTAGTEDHLRAGAVLAAAVAALDRRVLLVASGGLSHRFLPLRELRDRMGVSTDNIVSGQARDADLRRIDWWERGFHDRVVATLDDYARFRPEAGFGHYLTLLGALGGAGCTLRGHRYGEYESGIGTGQAIVWFPTG